MAERVPLTFNTTNSTIEELPSSIDLDLSGSNISNVVNVNSTGVVSATSFAGDGSNLTGIVSSPGGNTTQLQYNDSGNFAGIPTTTYDGTNLSLGNVANVKLNGGANGQFLQTDGAGNLSFQQVSTESYMLQPVRVASVANITSLSGLLTIDGIALSDGDRVLVWKQSTNTQNGIYIASSGTWTRASDTLAGGKTVTVVDGTRLAGITFTCVTNVPIVVGTTAILFQQSVNSGFISIWTQDNTFLNPAVGRNVGGATSIGVGATSGLDSSAYGYECKATGSGAVALGYDAKAGDSTVSVGLASGVTNQTLGVNIGRFAGRYNAGAGITAVGYGAHGTYATSAGATALGEFAGITGTNSVALGREAGRISSGGGSHSIAIGYQSAYQLGNANVIAIGATASYSSPNQESISIGREAGYGNLGTNSIAIGAFAGRTNQANNSIVLNATGANLNQTTANTFTVKPVRQVSDVTGLHQLYYDSTTGEIVYYVP
jgi:hypothetical protein